MVMGEANPQVVYVPSYNPVVVYGATRLPVPADLLPTGRILAAGMAVSFGVGVAMGAMWRGGWG